MASQTVEDRIAKQKADAEKRKKDQEAAAGGTPTSPAGIAGQGATPDQAKMAGTPATRTSGMGDSPIASAPADDALAQAAAQQEAVTGAAQDTTLQTEMGEKAFDEVKLTAAQERAKAFSEKMQSFGSLGDRVEMMVTEAFSGAEFKDTALVDTADDDGNVFAFEIDETQIANMAVPGKEAEATKAIQDFNLLRDDPQAAYQILVTNQHVFADPNSAMMDIVTLAYKNQPEVLREVVATMISENIVDPDEVSISHLLETGFLTMDGDVIIELGITETDLSDILGDQWKEMTPSQIGEEVERFRGDILANQEKIEEQLADPNLPPQTRIALINELKRMGATGVTQYEQAAKEASAEAADIGKVMFGGKIQDIEDLLDDENIQDQVINHLTDPTSDAAIAWAEANPEFSEWMSNEFGELEMDAADLKENIGNFKGIQKGNEDFVENNIEGASMSPEFMATMGYGDKGFKMDNYSPSDNPHYEKLYNTEPKEAQLAKIAQLDTMNADGSLGDINELDPDALDTIMNDPVKSKEFQAQATMNAGWDAIKATNDPDKMIDYFLDGATGSVTDSTTLRQRVAEMFSKSSFGGTLSAESEKLMELFDSDPKDGKVDDTDKIAARLSEHMKGGSSSAFVESGGVNELSATRSMPEPTAYDNSLYNKISKFFGPDDNFLDAGEIQQLMDAGELSSEELQQLMTMDGSVVDTSQIEQHQDTAAQRVIDNLLGGSGAAGFSLENINIADAVGGGPDSKMIQTRAMEIQTGLEDMMNSPNPRVVKAAKIAYRKFQEKMLQPAATEHANFTHAIAEFGHVLTFPFVPPGKEHLFSKTSDGQYRLTTGTDSGDYAGARDVFARYKTYQGVHGNDNPGGFMRMLAGLMPGDPDPVSDITKVSINPAQRTQAKEERKKNLDKKYTKSAYERKLKDAQSHNYSFPSFTEWQDKMDKKGNG